MRIKFSHSSPSSNSNILAFARQNHNLKILFYWGSFEDWKTIYTSKHSSLSCGAREDLANFKVRLNQNTSTSPLLEPDDKTLVDTHYMATTSHQFSALTPYYFFITLSNCDSQNDIYPGINEYMYSQGNVDAWVDFELTNGNTLGEGIEEGEVRSY